MTNTRPAQDALTTAREAHARHFPLWLKAQGDYRARRIGDQEFLAAKAYHDQLLAACDEAEAQLENRT